MSGESHVRDVIELAAAILLAASTVGSAWCAYQATLWSGEQIRSLAAANTAHFEALRKNSAANLAIMIDVNTFLVYIQDQARGEEKIADFIRRHARQEFRPIFEAWIAEQTPGAEPTDLPFKPPRYEVADMREAGELEKKATRAIANANAANAHGDLFVLHTVMFTLALFFLGATSEARRPGLRRTMFVLGALICTLSAVSMFRIPRGISEAGQERQTTFAPSGRDAG